MSGFNVAELFLDTVLADITFVVENENIPGHRIVFAKACDYFKNLLIGDEESQFNRFLINDTSAKAFKEVKRFIYLGHLSIGNWNVEDLLKLLALAKQLQLEDVLPKVIEALKNQQLDFDSWHSVKSAASIYGSIALEAKCVSFAEEKWTDFLQLRDLDKFTAEFFCFMLGCPKVVIDTCKCNQDELFTAISRWKMDRSEEEIRSVKCNIQRTSKNTILVLRKVFVSPVVNIDERHLGTQTTPDLETPSRSNEGVKRVRLLDQQKVVEPLKCMIRVDSLRLSKDRGIEFELPNNNGPLNVCLRQNCIVLMPKTNKELSVNRIEFEAQTKFSLKGIEIMQEFRTQYMLPSGPTPKNGWFKYRGVFSVAGHKLHFMYIMSEDFENMSEISFRNFVIY